MPSLLSSGPTGSGYIIVPQDTTPITHAVSSTDAFTVGQNIMVDDPEDESIVTNISEDDIKDMMAELPMSIANINSMNELLKLQMSDGLEGMNLDSALFDNFFTPEKDKSSILKQNQKEMDITQSALNEDLDIASIDFFL